MDLSLSVSSVAADHFLGGSSMRSFCSLCGSPVSWEARLAVFQHRCGGEYLRLGILKLGAWEHMPG